MSLTDVIEVNPRKLGGTPVFRGTRIPVYILFDYLEAGQSIDEFTDEYDIDRELVQQFVRTLRGTLVSEGPGAAEGPEA